MHSMRLRWNVEAFERISVRRASARALGRDSIFSLSDLVYPSDWFYLFFFLPGGGKEDHKNIPLSFFLSSFLSFVVSWMFFTHKTIPSSSSSSSSPSCHNSKT